MKTGRRLFTRFAFVAAFFLAVLPGDLAGQALLNPNTIPVALRLVNSDPVALSYLNGGSLPGMRAARIVARRNPPGSELVASSDVSIFGAAAQSIGLTVESDAAGYAYGIGNPAGGPFDSYVDFAPSSGAVRYYLSRVNSGPVLPRPAEVALVSLDVCAGILVLRFPASGSPFPITGGNVRVTVPGSGTLRSEVAALGAGISQAAVFVPGGEPVSVTVHYTTGGDPEVDLISYEERFAVTIPCDEVLLHDVPRPATAELGRIVGQLEMAGEVETFAQVTAINGPLGNRRTKTSSGPDFSTFELPNMVPSGLVSPPRGYEVYAQLNLQRESWFGSFRSPTLGRGSNPSVVVSAGETTDLGETLAFRPGYIQGRIYLQGPSEAAMGRPSALRSLVGSATSALRSHVYAQVNGEETPSNVGGDARATFDGVFVGDTTFDGSYRLVVAGLSRGGSTWNRAGLSLKLDSGSPTEPDTYVNQQLLISELINPRFQIPYSVEAGATRTNDLNYALSKVIVDLDVPGGLLWNPSLSSRSSGSFHFRDHGTDFQGNFRWYQAFVGNALGTPASASSRGQVVVYLPEGDFTLTPVASVAGAGGTSTRTEFPAVRLWVGRGQCIRVSPCLRVEITNTLECAGSQTSPIRGRVLTGCTNLVTRIEWNTPGGETNVLCEDCGANPSFAFILPTDILCAETAFVVTAFDDFGRVTSMSGAIPPDTTPPTLLCPTNLVLSCLGNSGTIVNYTVAANDNCSPVPDIVCTPPSGSFFPPGETVVRCRAYDQCQNSSACEFPVTVLSDCPPPCLVMRCPTNVVIPCQSPTGSAFYYDASATNLCSARPVDLRCSPVPGSFFPIGTTEVTCVAASEDEIADCRFNVTVLNECSPNDCLVLSCPKLLIWNCSGIDGAQVNFSVHASNRCVSADVKVTCSPPSGSLFRPGLTQVRCVAEGSDQIVRCQFPVIVLGANPWRGHALASRIVGDATVTALDGTFEVATRSSNGIGGLAFDLPGAVSLSLNLSHADPAEVHPNAFQKLTVMDLLEREVGTLEFIRQGSIFSASAAYAGLSNAIPRVFAFQTNGNLVELSNATRVTLSTALGPHLTIAASQRGGVIFSCQYEAPIEIQVDGQLSFLATRLLWSSEPASELPAVRLASVELQSQGFPPLVVRQVAPAFEPSPTVSGRILDHQGAPAPGVGLHLSGDSEPVATTDAQGYFILEIPAHCSSFELTPVKPFHQFTPARISFAAGMGDLETNFVALTPFRSWQQANWGTETTEAIVGPQADPDGDKLSNLLEYATGRNPKVADMLPPAPMTLSTFASNGIEYVSLKLDVISNATDLIPSIEGTADLNGSEWRPIEPVKVCSDPTDPDCRFTSRPLIAEFEPASRDGKPIRFFRPRFDMPRPPATPPQPAGNSHFRIAFFNAQFLPKIPGIAGEASTTSGCCEDHPDRPGALARAVLPAEIDILGLAEMFQDSPKNSLVRQLSPSYSSYVKFLRARPRDESLTAGLITGLNSGLGGAEAEIPDDSGLMLFSRFRFAQLPGSLDFYRARPGLFEASNGGVLWPHVAFTRFSDCEEWECLADKGAGLVRIRHPDSGDVFSVVFTHLANDGGAGVRRAQLSKIRELVDALRQDLPNEPVFIIGDFNVEGYSSAAVCSGFEWDSLFGSGRALGGYFSTVFRDAWFDQSQHDTSPLSLDDQDPGLTEDIHDAGSQSTRECPPYPRPGPEGRVDYLLTSTGSDPLRLVVQHMALAMTLRPGLFPRPAAFGEAGHIDLSDHYGIIADINRRAPRCNPQNAKLIAFAPTGEPQAVHPEEGFLGHAHSMQWYRVDVPGTYDVGIVPLNSDVSGFKVDVLDTRCLSLPLTPYREMTRLLNYRGQAVSCRTFDLPDGKFYVRILSLDPTAVGNVLGAYTLVIRRREGLRPEDAIVLTPNDAPKPILSPAGFATTALRWYLVDTEAANSGRAQRMNFYLQPTLPASTSYELSLADASVTGVPGARLQTSGPGFGRLDLMRNDVGGKRFYLQVTAWSAPENHGYEIGWNNNLTVVHGFYPQYTPGPIMPIEVRCFGQLHEDLQYHFLADIETSADDESVSFQIGIGHDGLLGPPKFSGGSIFLGNMDGGQARGVRFAPVRFLDDEEGAVWLTVDSPGYERGYANVVAGVIKPLPANVRTLGREERYLVEAERYLEVYLNPEADCPDCDARYTFKFYRSHGVPGIVERSTLAFP